MANFHALCIDTEFTSFDMIGGDLLTFGAVEVMDNFTLGRHFYGECKPRGTKYFTEGAEEKHKISYFKAMTFPDRRDVMITFLTYLYPLLEHFPLKVIYWGSWNFDLKWIELTMDSCDLKSSFVKAFRQNKDDHINALAIAKKLLRHMPIPKLGDEATSKKGQYTLDNVAKFYGIKHNHHEALSDALVTAEIYCKMMKREKVWTGELI